MVLNLNHRNSNNTDLWEAAKTGFLAAMSLCGSNLTLRGE